jgi:hypothetical protein
MADFTQSPTGIASLSLPALSALTLGGNTNTASTTISDFFSSVDGSESAQFKYFVFDDQTPVNLNPQTPTTGQLWPLGALLITPFTQAAASPPVATPDPAEIADPYFHYVQLLLNAETGFDSSLSAAPLVATNFANRNSAQKRYGNLGFQFQKTSDWYSASNLTFTSASYTTEFWIYMTTAQVSAALYAWIVNGTGSLGIMVRSDQTVALVMASINVLQHQTPISLNQWNHVALVKSNNSYRLFVNGVISTATHTAATVFSGAIAYVGDFNSALIGIFYMDEIRYTSGVARYRKNFTPPTGPFATTAYTLPPGLTTDPWFTTVSLLLHCEGLNGSLSFFDSSSLENQVTRMGNPIVSTTEKKFGVSSLELDGVGEDALVVTTADLALAGFDHTVEGWVYMRSLPSVRHGFMFNGTTTDNNNRIQIEILPSGAVSVYLQGATGTGQSFTSTAVLSLNTWTHIAYSMKGTTVYLFLNGFLQATGTYSTAITSSNTFYIGLTRSGDVLYSMNGFIDEFRVDRGYARYTQAFTPATAAHPDSGI